MCLQLSVKLQMPYDGNFSQNVFRIGEAIPPCHNTTLSFIHTDTHTLNPLQYLVNKPGGSCCCGVYLFFFNWGRSG